MAVYEGKMLHHWHGPDTIRKFTIRSEEQTVSGLSNISASDLFTFLNVLNSLDRTYSYLRSAAVEN